MNEYEDYIEIEDVCIKAASSKAALCLFNDGKEEWIPFSQIHDDCEIYEKGDTGTLLITKWIAEKKGLV